MCQEKSVGSANVSQPLCLAMHMAIVASLPFCGILRNSNGLVLKWQGPITIKGNPNPLVKFSCIGRTCP